MADPLVNGTFSCIFFFELNALRTFILFKWYSKCLNWIFLLHLLGYSMIQFNIGHDEIITILFLSISCYCYLINYSRAGMRDELIHLLPHNICLNWCGGGSRITVDNYTFDTVKEFIYLGSAVTTKNGVSLEIKRRITLANRCYYGLNGQLSNRDQTSLVRQN